MKTLVTLMFALMGASLASADNLPTMVIFQHSLHVGFAPPAHQGTFSIRLMDDGSLESIDSRGKLTSLGNLSNELVKNIQKRIDLIKNDTLTQPTEPPCMDAPSTDVRVQTTSNKTLEIYRHAGCRSYDAVDYEARQVAEMINDLVSALRTAERTTD